VTAARKYIVPLPDGRAFELEVDSAGVVVFDFTRPVMIDGEAGRRRTSIEVLAPMHATQLGQALQDCARDAAQAKNKRRR